MLCRELRPGLAFEPPLGCLDASHRQAEDPLAGMEPLARDLAALGAILMGSHCAADIHLLRAIEFVQERVCGSGNAQADVEDVRVLLRFIRGSAARHHEQIIPLCEHHGRRTARRIEAAADRMLQAIETAD